MPTLSWIQEGDFTKVQANTTTIEPPTTEPIKPVFLCPFCGRAFDDRTNLSQHITSAHPASTPRLVVGSREMLSEISIYTEINASEVLVFDCTDAEISIDNAPFKSIAAHAIPKCLASMRQGRANLILFNKFAANAQPIKAKFDLRFRVIAAEDVAKADQMFIRYLGKPDPEVADVARFCSVVGSGSVKDYADCYADYVLVVLERDGRNEADNAGRRQFSTLSRLQAFQSPLANLVSSLMRFISNDFAAVEASRAAPLLNGAYAMFAKMEGGTAECWESLGQSVATDGEVRLVCPIDASTDAVLRRFDQLGTLPRWSSLVEDSLRAEVANPRLPSLDRAKINALWAANALRLGETTSAIEPLRALEVNNCFGRWASLWIERLEP